MQHFPKWIKAPEGHPGHPHNPGFVLVNDEDQEREAKAGKPPRDLNPPRDDETERAPVEVGNSDGTVTLTTAPDPDKPLGEQSRNELIATLVRETLTDEVSDDDLRSAIEHARDSGTTFGGGKSLDLDKPDDELSRDELIAKASRALRSSDASEADLRFVIKVLDGDIADEGNDDHEERREDATDERTDAAGDKIAPDPAAEANKGDASKPAPGAPEAKPAPETDARPDEAKAKVADDKPAGNVTEAAATPPEHKKGATKAPGKK